MKFSICIPNYNYERYLGRTIQSALDQSHADLEVLVSDNASTDGSVGVVRGFSDPRIQLAINACNVGFAGNLDRAGRMATGDYMIMLSSDDLMRSNALATYAPFFQSLGEAASKAIVSSSWDIVGPDDKVEGEAGPDRTLWTEADRAPELESLVGGPVYRVAAAEMLRRCLLSMKNPFNFAATCYPRTLYERVEGYGGGRLFSPDKWFHWRVLSIADYAYFVDRKLFAYRWHPQNQVSQQSQTGALKSLVDNYVSTLELEKPLLDRLGIDRDVLIDAFVESDIARHGLATLAQGHRLRAQRILRFAQSAYPQHIWRNPKIWALSTLLLLGPAGRTIAACAYRKYRSTQDSSPVQIA